MWPCRCPAVSCLRWRGGPSPPVVGVPGTATASSPPGRAAAAAAAADVAGEPPPQARTWRAQVARPGRARPGRGGATGRETFPGTFSVSPWCSQFSYMYICIVEAPWTPRADRRGSPSQAREGWRRGASLGVRDRLPLCDGPALAPSAGRLHLASRTSPCSTEWPTEWSPPATVQAYLTLRAMDLHRRCSYAV
eukprot:scaffold2697_cov392-Prasinococcus_capsulatus_cf.AAC.11